MTLHIEDTASQSTQGSPSGRQDPPERGNWIREMTKPARLEAIALPIVWLMVAVTFSFLQPDTFLTGANATNILVSYSVPFILTLALVLPQTCGDYDLSVAATLALTSMVIAILNVRHGWPIGTVLVVALLIGCVVGLVNGALIVFFELDSLIVTLGSSTVIQGIILWISHSETISGISPSFVHSIIGVRLFTIPLAFYYGLVLCTILWYVLQHTVLGKRLIFVGRGRSVARLSGLHVRALRIGSFVCAGAIASLAGIVYSGTTGSADPTSGLSYLLPAFAAVFLGATTVIPGRFNAWGCFIAVYFLATGITGLQLLGAQSYVQQLFYGLALVIAVLFARLVQRKRAKSDDAA